MIIDPRHECVDFIARSIRKTAEWRLSLAKRFPGDARNTRAAERLGEIANEATELSDNAWEGLKPHFHWADERFGEAVSQANRNVVFRHDTAGPGNLHRTISGISA